MDCPTQKPTVTPHKLVIVVEEYIGDNKHHGLVEHRWLADWLTETLSVARQVRSGGSLEPKYQELVIEFRLAELAASKAQHEKEIEGLDRETRKLVAERA